MLALQIKNTHLNQAIHEEQEAIMELRVQLRLLQGEKLQPEQPPQTSPEARADSQPPTPAGPAAADGLKPSPSKDRREVNL